MNKLKKMLWIALAIGFSTTALAGSNQDIGTVVGGIAGGLLGHNLAHGSGRTAATIGGAVIGSVVGNQVGSTADASERCQYTPYPHYNHWESYQRPRVYPPIYKNTFIGRDGRLCRHSLLTNSFGDRMYATYCCYRTAPDGYCVRWVRTTV